MSSFNHIEKVSYTKVHEEPVSLIEYIVFTDERNEKKQVIFKLRNNLNQILKAIKINVYQYDENDNLIEKSLLAYNNFEAKAQELFVPNAKFDLNYKTKAIEVNLEYALFERLTWEDKKLNVIPYTRIDFDKEFTKENPKCKEEKVKVAKINKGKRVTKAKDIIKQNVPKGPKVFAIILSVLLLAFVFGSSIYNRINTYKFSDDSFEYSKVDNRVTIEKFIGDEADVIIPADISGMKIYTIGEGAFEGSNIKSVSFMGNSLSIGSEAFKNCTQLRRIVDYNCVVNINSNAFENCDSLTQVKFLEARSVSKNAFKSCDSLTYVNMPKAYLNSRCFFESYNVTSLKFGSTSVTKLMDLFTDGYDEYEINLTTVSTNAELISKGFFKECSKVTDVSFTNKDVRFEYGALAGTSLGNIYEDNGVFETFNGVIISYNSQTNKVVFREEATEEEIETMFEYIGSNRIEDVVVETPLITVNEEFLKNFPYVSRLEIGKDVKFEIEATSSLYNRYLNTLCLDVSFEGLNQYVKDCGITNLELRGEGTVSYSVLEGLNQIRSLKIHSTLTRVENDSLRDLSSLEELQIPNFIGKTLVNYGVNTSLKTLTIVRDIFGNTVLGADFIEGYYNLRTVNFGTKYNPFYPTKIESNFISYCDNITELVIPDSVTSLELGFIGYNCMGLTHVTMPFIGRNDTLSNAYMDMNKSYSYTVSLTVTKDTVLHNNFSNGLYNLRELIFESKITRFGNGCFGGLTELNYFEFATDVELSAFSNYLSGNNLIVNKFVIRSCDFAADTADFLSGLTVNNFVILKAKYLPENIFTNITSYITAVYIGDIEVDEANYKVLDGFVNKLYFKNEIPEGLELEFSQVYGNMNVNSLGLVK